MRIQLRAEEAVSAAANAQCRYYLVSGKSESAEPSGGRSFAALWVYKVGSFTRVRGSFSFSVGKPSNLPYTSFASFSIILHPLSRLYSSHHHAILPSSSPSCKNRPEKDGFCVFVDVALSRRAPYPSGPSWSTQDEKFESARSIIQLDGRSHLVLDRHIANSGTQLTKNPSFFR